MTTYANKFLSIDSGGVITELTGVTTSTANAIPALDGSGLLSITMMPAGVGGAAVTATVGTAGVTAGDLVCFSGTTTLTVNRAKADSMSTRAQGFVLDTVTSGNTVTVYLEGIDTAIVGGGAAGGVELFLSDTTGGQVTATRPTDPGTIVQSVGFGVGVTGAAKLMFIPGAAVQL